MTAIPPRRLITDIEDSARWLGFPYRQGDIVISTRSKMGTTWMQMICALLIFKTPRLPGNLAELSPWLDWLVSPRDQVYGVLEAQSHRRFIKTHTPLYGISLDPRATYIVVGRHPLDAAVSLYYQADNIDRARMRELTGQTEPSPEGSETPRLPVRDWLVEWIGQDADPYDDPDSLAGVMMHLSDAWARRRESNVVMVHYDDLRNDLSGQMRKLARRLEIEVPSDVWPSLVDAATFEEMRRRPDVVAPDPVGIFKDAAAFFRRGSSGAADEILTSEELERYRARADALGQRDMLAWLHRERQDGDVGDQ